MRFRITGIIIRSGNILPISHRIIADMCGTTIESSTRILNQLKKAGALQLERNKIIILSQEKLDSYIYK